MKFYVGILSFLAVHSASAFSVPGPQQSSTALGVSESFENAATGKSSPSVSLSSLKNAGTSIKNVNQGPPPQKSRAPGSISSAITKDIWETASIVQGSSLRTWSCSSLVERVQVLMKTDGRPCNANIELWQGPDNTPHKVDVYLEDGLERPFSAVIETPRESNAICIRNTATIEYPLFAVVEADNDNSEGLGALQDKLLEMGTSRVIQGGSIHTFPFEHKVASVQVMLKTDGRPLNARIELMQGPNNNKQVMEIYTEDGMERPFFVVMESPGAGNVVRLINTGTIEFPLIAYVAPFSVDE